MPSAEDTDQQIEIFKVKKLIKNLEAAKGNGTSMISLILPPGSQISQVNKMLSDEYGTASNIKSRVNRLSVLGAITSTQQRLKLYNKCPKVIPDYDVCCFVAAIFHCNAYINIFEPFYIMK